MQCLGVQHVSLPRPPGSEQETRAFYGGVLGLEETQPPQSIRGLDLIWFRLGDQELHLFREDPVDDPSRRHLCLEVADVDAVSTRLVEAGYPVEETIPIPNRPRFFCRDPFGNLLEFTTILGDYEAAEKG